MNIYDVNCNKLENMDSFQPDYEFWDNSSYMEAEEPYWDDSVTGADDDYYNSAPQKDDVGLFMEESDIDIPYMVPEGETVTETSDYPCTEPDYPDEYISAHGLALLYDTDVRNPEQLSQPVSSDAPPVTSSGVILLEQAQSVLQPISKETQLYFFKKYGALEAQARSEYAEKLPPLKWYVPGLLASGVTVEGGRSGVGKSWLTLDLAYSIATGTPFLSMPVEQARVLYVEPENSLQSSNTRFHKFLAGRAEPSNLFFAQDSEPWEYKQNGKDLINSLQEWIKYAGIQVFIFDTYADIAPRPARGEDEYQRVIRFTKAMKEAIDGTDVAILGTMHCNKSVRNDENPFDALLGSVGWKAKTTGAMLLERSYNSSIGRLRTEGKNGKPLDIALNYDLNNCRWSFAGNSSDLEKAREKADFENAPITKLCETLLSVTDPWVGTASEAVAIAQKHEILNINPGNFGKELHKVRDKLLTYKSIKVYNKKSNTVIYTLTRHLDIQGPLTRPLT